MDICEQFLVLQDYIPQREYESYVTMAIQTLEEWGKANFKAAVYQTLLEFAGHEFMKDL